MTLRSSNKQSQALEVKLEELVATEPSDSVKEAKRSAKERQHEYLVMLAAAGLSSSQIAEEICSEASLVDDYISDGSTKQEIKTLRDKIFDKDILGRMKSLASKALDAIEDVLENQQVKAQIKLQAATYILDQTVGKAQQNIKVEGNVLGEVIHRLEQMKIRDVAPAKALAAPIDPLDTFINEAVPENLTVGQKGGYEEA